MERTCVFCAIAAGRAPCSEVYRDHEFMAFMDIHPWSPGHVLVVPKEHRQHVRELPHGLRERLFGVGSRIAEAVRESELGCDDVHFLLNDGRAAQQTVPHVHMHILPRRRGDLAIQLVRLLVRPVIPIFGAKPRPVLDRHAALIRAALPDLCV